MMMRWRSRILAVMVVSIAMLLGKAVTAGMTMDLTLSRLSVFPHLSGKQIADVCWHVLE